MRLGIIGHGFVGRASRVQANPRVEVPSYDVDRGYFANDLDILEVGVVSYNRTVASPNLIFRSPERCLP